MSAFDFGNFFAEVDNSAVEAGRFEAPDGDTPIPNNTKLPVVVERAEYYEKDNITLSLMWRVTGGDFANRVVFQKLLLAGEDTWAKDAEKSAKKRAKARTQFAIMVKLAKASKVQEALASGKLPAIDLVSSGICGKPLEITVGTWDMTGDDGMKRKGNWVKAVGAREAAQTAQVAPPASHLASAAMTDDEIPF